MELGWVTTAEFETILFKFLLKTSDERKDLINSYKLNKCLWNQNCQLLNQFRITHILKILFPCCFERKFSLKHGSEFYSFSNNFIPSLVGWNLGEKGIIITFPFPQQGINKCFFSAKKHIRRCILKVYEQKVYQTFCCLPSVLTNEYSKCSSYI